jgi:hypothetical protein
VFLLVPVENKLFFKTITKGSEENFFSSLDKYKNYIIYLLPVDHFPKAVVARREKRNQ